MPSVSSAFIRPDELLRSLGLRAGETLVHLGCGAGFYVVPAAKIVGSTGKVIGIDVLPDMLAEVENRARRASVGPIVQTIRADLEQNQGSTLIEGGADWVLVANILHQSDAPKILSEAKRVAKKGGKIVVIEWDVVATPLGPPPEKRIPKMDVISLIQAAGLQVMSEFTPSAYHYGLIVSSI